MALPTQDYLKTMDASFLGLPFVCLDLTDGSPYTMDYSFHGGPIIWNAGSAASTIKQIHETPFGNIKNIHGKQRGSIKTFGPTSTT
jgi:hypothetical protein